MQEESDPVDNETDEDRTTTTMKVARVHQMLTCFMVKRLKKRQSRRNDACAECRKREKVRKRGVPWLVRVQITMIGSRGGQPKCFLLFVMNGHMDLVCPSSMNGYRQRRSYLLLNSVAQQPMRAKTSLLAHLRICDHWALRCMCRCPDQVVSLKRNSSSV
ncbi:hypothetical protein TNCV_3187311 [Trichonephila clavipes]|nr:hypothetical protein TNCV_3187311 [Trichonephila clavipes]